MFEGLTCVYKSNVDLFFYVVGSTQENEVSKSCVIHQILRSGSLIVQSNLVVSSLDVPKSRLP